LKWLCDQDGVAAVPKASRGETQQANRDLPKITLDDAARAKIAALNRKRAAARCGSLGMEVSSGCRS
jgi:2,5-diketo-D-gluconate reductase B